LLRDAQRTVITATGALSAYARSFRRDKARAHSAARFSFDTPGSVRTAQRRNARRDRAPKYSPHTPLFFFYFFIVFNI